MDASTMTTTMLGSDRPILDRVTEWGPAAATAGVQEPPFASVKNLHCSDDNDRATNNHLGDYVKSIMETKDCDEESSSKWCEALQATALQRTKQADEILAAFDNPDRQLLIVKGPCGGMYNLCCCCCSCCRCASH
jgi:hypothetical protein